MVSDAKLKELEDIGKNLPKSKQVSHDAPDLFFLRKLIDEQPNLVPRGDFDYYNMYEKKLLKDPDYSSFRKIAQKEGLQSHSPIIREFKKIDAAILEMRKTQSKAPVKEIPALDIGRLNEIYTKKGKLVQLDPYALLPPEGHKDYAFSRYFQKRRGPRKHPVSVLAESIGKFGVIEPPTVQDHNHRRRLGDGFGRIEGWLLADKKAGGTPKKPVLEFPVCLLADFTDAEGELINLEKNSNKDNWDLGDRDYSIVTMHERHPEVYTVTKLAELNNMDKSTISTLIGAWQNSWPTDEKKGWSSATNPIRQALEDRQITTYHGRALARLKDWPNEQIAVGEWLLHQVELRKRSDVHFRDYWEHEVTEESREGVIVHKFDVQGFSAGKLMQMVRDRVAKMENINKVKIEIKKMLKAGTIGKKIHEDKIDDIRREISSSCTKEAFKLGLRAAGVSITTVKPKAKDVKPSSPATPGVDASSQTTVLTAETVGLGEVEKLEPEPEPEPMKVCWNCPIAWTGGDEISCQIGLEPDEENECHVQFSLPGRAHDTRFQCHYCGGLTIPDFIQHHNVEVFDEMNEDGWMHRYHALCKQLETLKEQDLKGACHGCAKTDCQLVNVVGHFGADVTVNHCPKIKPVPSNFIEELNKEVEKQLANFLEIAQEDFAAAKKASTESPGGTTK